MGDVMNPPSLRPPGAQGLSDEMLEELNRLWTIVRAFSNTAHDVNNALQVIAGNAELLEARDLDAVTGRRVGVMRAESGKAATAINRLLTFARAARQPVQTLDVWPLLDSAVEFRLASLGRGRVTLAVDRTAPVPALISAEASRVLQLLLDVLFAAEDAVAGRAKARIDVMLHSGERDVRLRVATSYDASNADRRDGEEVLSFPEELTRQAQIWAAAHLAERTGGALTIEDGTFTVSWPAV